MVLTEDKILAAEKVLRFADKYLEGNLDNLLSISLSKLWNDGEFGCPGRERYDNDDTEIMRYIYVLVFSDFLHTCRHNKSPRIRHPQHHRLQKQHHAEETTKQN